MPNTCPLCGQQLPKAIDEQKLHAKLEKMNASAAEAERRKLEREFSERLSAERELERKKAAKEFDQRIKKAEADTQRQVQKARQSAAAETERLMKRQMDELKKQMADAENKKAAEVAKARKEASETSQREVRLAIQKATLENEKKLTALQVAREKEQVRHSSEIAKFQGKLEDLSRKLEKQSNEELREEGEFDLYSSLVQEFPADKIERVKHGERGGDIIHRVMDGGNEAGRIVYESKNHSTWKNDFISQAKKYHTQYETLYVMVVARVFPNKKRSMCVVQGVPVVEPRLAVSLASVMREGILEIAKLRLTNVDTDEKAKELFTYIIGNEFQTRFRDMAQAVEGLKDFQQSERKWHENQWVKESELHGLIEKRHRELDAKLHLIVKGAVEGRKPMAVAAGRGR